MADAPRPGTRRIPLIPADELAATERLLGSVQDLLLALEASFDGGVDADRAARQVFVDETLDELRRLGWTLRELGSPVAALGALAGARTLPGGRMAGSDLATLYSGGGTDLFGSPGGARRIIERAKDEVTRALTVLRVVASYGETASGARSVGLANLSASGSSPTDLGLLRVESFKSGLRPGR
jgi:hypothetical protein